MRGYIYFDRVRVESHSYQISSNWLSPKRIRRDFGSVWSGRVRLGRLFVVLFIMAGVAFSFRQVRTANPIELKIGHPQLAAESSNMAGFRFLVEAYRLSSIRQAPSVSRPRRSLDDILVDDETPPVISRPGSRQLEPQKPKSKPKPHITLSIRLGKSNSASPDLVLTATSFVVLVGTAVDAIVSMDSRHTRNQFSARCSAAAPEFSKVDWGCDGTFRPNESASICFDHDSPLVVNYVDLNDAHVSKEVPKAHCVTIVTTGLLELKANGGFTMHDAGEVRLYSRDALNLTKTKDGPVLLERKYLDFGDRVVREVRIVSGDELQFPWSLRMRTRAGPFFEMESRNTSLLEADGEQLLRADLVHNLPSRLRVEESDLGRAQEFGFSLYDRFHETEMSGVMISSSGLGDMIQFRNPYLFPAIKEFWEEVPNLIRVNTDSEAVRARLADLLHTYIRLRVSTDSPVEGLSPALIRERLLEEQPRGSDSGSNLARIAEEIEVRGFEAFVKDELVKERDHRVSGGLQKMLEWLTAWRAQGEASYQVGRIPSTGRSHVLMGLDLPKGYSPGIYKAEVIVVGKNISATRTPLEVEVYNKWAAVFSHILDWAKLVIGALLGALLAYYVESKKKEQPSRRIYLPEEVG